MTSEERTEMLEKLKMQRNQLTNPDSIDLLSKYQSYKETKTPEQTSGPSIAEGESKGKSLSLLNGNIKGFDTPYNQYRKNGYVSAFMLGGLTFVFELLFLTISYFIFR